METPGQSQIKFDKADEEANRIANDMAKREAVTHDEESPEMFWRRVQTISKKILSDLNRIFTESGENTNDMILKDFLDYLVEEKPLGYVDTSYKIKHFRECFPNEVNNNDSMTTFLQKVGEKNLQASDFLNSKN